MMLYGSNETTNSDVDLKVCKDGVVSS